MENFLGNIYCWFQSLYGQGLSYYLWGYNPSDGYYTNPNLYNIVGIVTLVISLVLVVFYYYVINIPRLCKWWSWLITLGINGMIALFVGYGMVASRYTNGYIPDEFLYPQDSANDIIINVPSDFWGFGMANIFVATMMFVILSFMLKWWSSGAKHVPFL